MKYTKDMIWDVIYGLLEERNQEKMCLYEGVKRWEDEIGDIKDVIEELAMDIEADMDKEVRDEG